MTRYTHVSPPKDSATWTYLRCLRDCSLNPPGLGAFLLCCCFMVIRWLFFCYFKMHSKVVF